MIVKRNLAPSKVLGYVWRPLAVAAVGAVVDTPFDATTTDVPMTAICRSIERDLLEQLGVAALPPPLEPVDGYLW